MNTSAAPISERRDLVCKRIIRVVKYVQRFGWGTGLRLAWQVLARRPCAVRLPGYAAPLEVRRNVSDALVFEKIFLEEEYGDIHLCPPPSVIVDAGANVGYASIYFARLFPGARILALEPEADNFRQLARNVAAYPAITPLPVALWPSVTRLALDNPEGEPWSYRYSDGSPRAPGTVEAITIEELMRRHGLARIDVLKLDIEGAEKPLFEAAATTWLERVGAVMIELHDRMQPGCSAALLEALRSWKAQQYLRGEVQTFMRNERAP